MTENKTHKQHLQKLQDKGRHDDELIEALFVCIVLLLRLASGELDRCNGLTG